MVNYKTLIDSTELQQKVLDYITSDEFSKMVDSTVFKDNNQCRMAIIHGMAIASMLTCRCKPLYINFKKENRKHGHWFVLDECANEGVYCSVCSKKVYKLYYANQKLKSMGGMGKVHQNIKCVKFTQKQLIKVQCLTLVVLIFQKKK